MLPPIFCWTQHSTVHNTTLHITTQHYTSPLGPDWSLHWLHLWMEQQRCSGPNSILGAGSHHLYSNLCCSSRVTLPLKLQQKFTPPLLLQQGHPFSAAYLPKPAALD